MMKTVKDATSVTDGTTWLEKVRDGDRQAAHSLLLQEQYVGEACNIHGAAIA